VCPKCKSPYWDRSRQNEKKKKWNPWRAIVLVLPGQGGSRTSVTSVVII